MTTVPSVQNGRRIMYSTRRVTLILALGIVIEITVAISGILIRQLFWGTEPIWSKPELYRFLVIANSIVGFFGSVILSYGVLTFIKGFRVGKSALQWVHIAVFVFMTYKAFDILQTVHWQYLRDLFNLYWDIDIMISNLLLVGAGLAAVVGMVRALYDSNQSNLKLEEQNAVLDREIRERQKSESHTRASEEKLSAIFNALSSPIFLVDREGRLLAHNSVFSMLFDGSRKTLIGLSLGEFIPAEAYETGWEHARKVFDTQVSEIFILSYKDHSWDVRIYPVRGTSGSVPCITILATDITEFLHNEDERRLLETSINNAAESIVITDQEGRIEYVNPSFEEQTGYSRLEVMGRTPAILKSGKQDAAYYRELWQTIKNGEVWRGRFINRRKDGTLFYENATISPITREDGVIEHFVAVKRNITREYQLEQQLRQSQKIEALGTLAGGIAHDLNNVLAIILGRGELALEMLEEGHPGRESLETIIRTATRSSKLIKHLLMFTRQGTSEQGSLCVAPLIKEQIKVIRSFIPSNVQLVENIAVDKEIIIADPSEIQQIVVNILNNANHAMKPDGGTLEISLESCTLKDAYIAQTGMLKPGDYIRLRVRDTGCGMTDDVLKRIFDPFFTTKEVGEGTGLGLPMVHGSVLRSGGQIDVSSTPGQGSTFDIYWPEAPPEALSEPETHERVSGKGITVLVIDDLSDFNDLLAMNLSNRGYVVRAFSEVMEALDYFKENAPAIDVAVVDYMMPGMNGKELAEVMHAVRPDLPVILLSGYASGITNINAHEHGFAAMLDKPVEIEELSRDLAKLAAR